MKGEIKIGNEEIRGIISEYVTKKLIPPVRVTDIRSEGYGYITLMVGITDEAESEEAAAE